MGDGRPLAKKDWIRRKSAGSAGRVALAAVDNPVIHGLSKKALQAEDGPSVSVASRVTWSGGMHPRA